MKNIKIIFFLPLLATMFFLSCSSPQQRGAAGDWLRPDGAAMGSFINQYDGLYVFDVETFKAVQLRDDASEFKKMKKENLEKALKIFQSFTIELSGDRAVATFSHDVVKGEVSVLSRSGEEVRLKMTPLDQKKRDETVMLVIRGRAMVMDPGRRESDKMFFIKFLE